LRLITFQGETPTVSNTSTLLNLAIIGELERVRRQFGQVVVPPSVVEEFCLEEGRPGSPALKEAIEEGRILTESPSNRPLIRTLRQDLDRGESGAIALATEKLPPKRTPAAYCSTNGKGVVVPETSG
jgi:hypothetical protein